MSKIVIKTVVTLSFFILCPYKILFVNFKSNVNSSIDRRVINFYINHIE